ncbi:hypothetical protein SRRS_52020 [Sporomusa rhizae]|uniref:HIT family protein n=1 Tax=Sporomusa rhizae TaxID=357999 RepID=UPI00352B2BC3
MCLTCSIVNAELLPTGGIIYKDDYIVLHHCIDINIPGYLIISPLRHVESFSDLNQTEILQMGTIMKLAVTALEQVDGVEKVYIANFGEETTHFHMHIFPRYKWMLNQSAQDIYIGNRVDGAKLLSFYRQKCKTTPELMKENDIVAVTAYIQNLISSHISG